MIYITAIKLLQPFLLLADTLRLFVAGVQPMVKPLRSSQRGPSGVTGVFAMDMKMKPRKRSTPPTATVGNSPMHPNIGL